MNRSYLTSSACYANAAGPVAVTNDVSALLKDAVFYIEPLAHLINYARNGFN